MIRSRVGDVYAIKVPNGYKLYQRAYDIPKQGDFIRVFDGLYDSIPNNIEEIALGPHSFIISFYASRAYRIGLAQMLGNYSVPEQYPFPDYMFSIFPTANEKIYKICVTRNDVTGLQTFQVNRMEELPIQFRELKLLSPVVTPNWLLYLFDINWSPANLSQYFPGRPGEDYAAILQPYTDIVNAALERDRAKKNRISKK